MAPVADNCIWAGLRTVFFQSTINRLSVDALFLHRQGVCGHKTQVFQPANRKRLKFNIMHAVSNPLFYCISWPLQLTIEFGLVSEHYFCNRQSIGFLLMPYSCNVWPYVDTKHKFFQPPNRKRLKFNIMHAVSNPLFYCISWPLQLTIEFGLVSEQYFCNLGSIGFLLRTYSCIVWPYVDIKHKFFQPANRKRLTFNIMHAVSNPLFYCISWPLQLTIEFGLVSEQYFCNLQSIGFLLMPYSCIGRAYVDTKHKFFQQANRKILKFNIMHAVSNPLFYCISWPLQLTIEFRLISEQYFCNLQSIGFLLMPYSCIGKAYMDTKHRFFKPANRKRLKFNIMHAVSNPLFYCISWPLQLTIEFGLVSEQYFCNLQSIGFLLMPYSCIGRAYVDTKHKFFQPANRKILKFNIMHAVSNPLFYCISWPLQLTIEFGLISEQYFCNLQSIGFLLMPYSCIGKAYMDTKHRFFKPANRKRLKFNIMNAVSNPLFHCISQPLQLTIEFGLVAEQYFCNLGSIGFLLMPYSCIVWPYVDIKHKFFQPANRKRLKFNIMHAVSNPLFYCISWPLQLTIVFDLVSEQYFCNLQSIGFLSMPYSCIGRAYVETKHKFFQPANRKRLKFNIMHAVSNPLFYSISWPLQLTIEFGLVSEQYFCNLQSIGFLLMPYSCIGKAYMDTKHRFFKPANRKRLKFNIMLAVSNPLFYCISWPLQLTIEFGLVSEQYFCNLQ